MALGGSIIGALRVVLGADAAAFEDGMTAAEKRLSQFKNVLGKGAIGIGAALAGIGTAVGVAISGAMDKADELATMSKKFDQPVEQLSKLQYVADRVGVSFDTLAGNLQKSMTDANSIGGRTLAAIGISAENSEGKMKGFSDILAEIADKLGHMKDGSDKTTLATNILGEEAAKLIPVFNRVQGGIKDLIRDAERFGFVVTQQTADAATRFRAALTLIGGAASGLRLQLEERLAPIMAVLAEQFANLVRQSADVTNQSGFLKIAIETLAVAFKTLVSAVIVTGAQLQAVWIAVKTGIEVVKAFASLDMAAAWEAMRKGTVEAADAAMAAVKALDDLWSEAKAGEDPLNKLQNKIPPVVKSFQDMQMGARAALNELVNSPWHTVEEKLAAINEAAGQGLINALQKSRMELQLQQTQWRALNDEAKAALDQVINSPTETFAAKMKAVEDAVRNGTLAFRDLGKTVQQIQRENMNHMTDLASATANALTTIFAKSKTAGIAAALINTAVAITKAMQLPFPFNWAQAALAAATGAAQVSAIKSTNIGGGGSVSAPNAGAGAAMQAEPAPAQQQTMFVQGFREDELWRGDGVRRVAEALVNFQRDGGQVVFQNR